MPKDQMKTEVGKKLRANHGLAGSRGAAAVREAQAWADATYDLIAAALPSLSYDGYCVASGRSVNERVRVSGPGVKSFTVQMDGRLASPPVFGYMTVLKEVGRALRPVSSFPFQPTPARQDRAVTAVSTVAWNDVMNVVVASLVEPYGQAVFGSLNAAVRTADRRNAELQVRKNSDAILLRRRKAALLRLQEEMQRYDFLEEDVLEAWRISQIRKVQES